MFLSSQFCVDEHKIYDSITDGGNDLGVDAIYINRFGDQPSVHVIQSKFHASERKASNPFKISAVRKFRDFLLAVKNRETDLAKISNPVLAEKIHEIRELQKDTFPLFKLWVISNGTHCKASEIDAFANEVSKFDAEVSEFHLSQFYDLCIAKKSKRTDHAFFTRGKEVAEISSSSAKGVVGIISARELFDLISDITEPGKIDFGLFDLNIRGFLGSDNQINRQIYQSAVSENNERFCYLNNGITLTCSKLEIRRTTQTPKVGAKDLKIVNGAQTCGAIFKAIIDYNCDFQIFRDLAVNFRLFETNDPDFVDDIAISSNSQTRVNARDLKANHEYQFKIESELAARGIQYQRKRGLTSGYQNLYEPDENNKNSIDALKVGQILLAYFHKQPERSKRDSDNIFESLYNKIFSDIDFDDLKFAIELYWKIMRYREFVEEEIRIKGRQQAPRDFITYGVFHVLFACRVLIYRYPEKKNSPDELVEEALELVQSVVTSAGTPAYYIFFRRPDSSNLIEEFGIQRDLFSIAS